MQLYLGDCLEVMPTFPDNSVDLILTDPPYSETTHQGARTAARRKVEYWRKDPDILINFGSFEAVQIYKAFNCLGRICKAWVVSFMEWRFMHLLEEEPPTDLRFVRFGVWIKPNGAPQFTGDRPGTGWEAIAILHKIGGRMKWNGGGHHAVWQYNKPHQDSYIGDHPTVKPLDLVKDIILKFTNFGDVVFDPFMGSGTTGVACVETGRDFIGIEIDPHYFEIAKERIETAQMQPRLFEEKCDATQKELF